MKKVLYIVSTLRRSGPINQLYNIVKYLNKNEFDPYLVTLSPEPEDSRRTDYNALGIHLYSLNLTRFRGFFFAKNQIQSVLSEIKPDVIHTHGIRGDIISSKLHTYIPKLTTVRNLPQIDYSIRYGFITGKILYILHINALKKLSICIGVSDAVTNNIKNKISIKDVLTIKNGVDTEFYFPIINIEKNILRKKLNLPVNTRILLGSGGVHSNRKDPLFLIRVFNKSLKLHDNVHLVLVGTGNLHDRCKHESNGNKNIHIIKRVDNFVDYLKSSDYYVSSSYAEGLPNAVLEAMACGLPVLLSDIEPHKEIITCSQGAGFCYVLGNQDNFMLMLNKILYENYTEMSNFSLEAVKNNFNAQKMSGAYQNIYHELILSSVKIT